MVDARGPSERTGLHGERRGSPGMSPMVALGIIGVLAAITLILAFLLWRDDDAELTEGRQDTTVATIAQDPESWIGEQVSVSGEVSEVLTPFAFVLGGEQFVGGDELLVIGPPPAVGTPDEVDQEAYPQDIVQVAGEIREFNRTELEEEWNVELPEEAFEGRDTRVVLVGETVGLTQRVRAVEADAADVSEILDEPDAYHGETVTVSDSITSASSERVFVLGDGLIVVDMTERIAETALEDGVRIEATGVIHTFEDSDLGDEDVAGYEGNPVLHAGHIQVLDEQS